MDIPENVINKDLYIKAKQEADLKYKRHGLYKSAFIVKRYTELGGKYRGSVPKSTGINRWLKAEEWIQVLPYLDSKIVKCGSSEGEMIACRPSKRATTKTPITIQEVIKKHGKDKVRQLAEYKERHPASRINWGAGIVS
jgi:hypothetical protein